MHLVGLACRIGGALAWLAALSPAARTQSFDCTKAASPVEIAICGSDALRAADADLAKTYIRALADADPERATQLRGGQRAWLGERNACGTKAGTDLAECLDRSYRTRTAAIASLPVAATALPPLPAPAAATLSRTTVPAGGESEALLTVASAGRFTLRTQSTTGVALQLVDMIAGPGEFAGIAGTRDGRLDVLLDAGVYKLRFSGAKAVTGNAAVSVTPFVTVGGPDAAHLRGGSEYRHARRWTAALRLDVRRLQPALVGRSVRPRAA